VWINDVAPEEAARRLREAGGAHVGAARHSDIDPDAVGVPERRKG
jgi:hypothetical protein